MNRRDDWIDEDEYPDERDIEDFGDYSPYDDDPLTIGYPRGQRPKFWTPTRILIAAVFILLILSFLLVELAPLLSR
jgi:hypothetical protein